MQECEKKELEIFNLKMGVSFKCGVCGKKHTSLEGGRGSWCRQSMLHTMEKEFNSHYNKYPLGIDVDYDWNDNSAKIKAIYKPMNTTSNPLFYLYSVSGAEEYISTINYDIKVAYPKELVFSDSELLPLILKNAKERCEMFYQMCLDKAPQYFKTKERHEKECLIALSKLNLPEKIAFGRYRRSIAIGGRMFYLEYLFGIGHSAYETNVYWDRENKSLYVYAWWRNGVSALNRFVVGTTYRPKIWFTEPLERNIRAVIANAGEWDIHIRKVL